MPAGSDNTAPQEKCLQMGQIPSRSTLECTSDNLFDLLSNLSESEIDNSNNHCAVAQQIQKEETKANIKIIDRSFQFQNPSCIIKIDFSGTDQSQLDPQLQTTEENIVWKYWSLGWVFKGMTK